jgi:hypothetical protein
MLRSESRIHPVEHPNVGTFVTTVRETSFALSHPATGGTGVHAGLQTSERKSDRRLAATGRSFQTIAPHQGGMLRPGGSHPLNQLTADVP